MDKTNYQFFMEHDVSKYIGEWIAICNQQIVAHGPDVKKVYQEVSAKFPKERPFITRVPNSESMIF